MSTTKSLAAAGLAVSTFLLTACGDKPETTEASLGVAEAAKAAYPEAPDAAMQYVAAELASGNGGVLWEAMPASYQSDINKLAQLAGTKIDGEIYDQVFGIVGRLGGVIDSKKEFILNTELGGAQPPEQKAMMEEALPSIVSLIDTISSSPIASSAGLQSFDGQIFFDSTVSSLLKDIEAMSKLQGEEAAFSLADLGDMEISVIDSTETTATLKSTVAGQEPLEEAYSKIEGRWVPEELATQWADGIGSATAQLEAVTPEQIEAQKPQAQMVLGMIDGVLTQLEGAETQAQFDQALQGAMMPLMGLMMMGQGMGAPPAAPDPLVPMPAPAPAQ
ncbi:MAG: hypothetical protein ACPGKS_00695 [Coraliomargarita sp.]